MYDSCLLVSASLLQLVSLPRFFVVCFGRLAYHDIALNKYSATLELLRSVQAPHAPMPKVYASDCIKAELLHVSPLLLLSMS